MCLNIFRKGVLKEDALIYMIKCEKVRNKGKKLYFFLNCACRQVSLLQERNEVRRISIRQWSMTRLLFV
jgi:hypothetical protein